MLRHSLGPGFAYWGGGLSICRNVDLPNQQILAEFWGQQSTQICPGEAHLAVKISSPARFTGARVTSADTRQYCEAKGRLEAALVWVDGGGLGKKQQDSTAAVDNSGRQWMTTGIRSRQLLRVATSLLQFALEEWTLVTSSCKTKRSHSTDENMHMHAAPQHFIFSLGIWLCASTQRHPPSGSRIALIALCNKKKHQKKPKEAKSGKNRLKQPKGAKKQEPESPEAAKNGQQRCKMHPPRLGASVF